MRRFTDRLHETTGKAIRPGSLVLLIVSGLMVLAGCAQQQLPVDSTPAGLASRVDLPATFTGRIPCDDCERVDIVLNLRPDSLYQLRKTYVQSRGGGRVEAQMGLWRFSPEENLLILGKQKGLLKTYAVAGNGELRFLDWEGAGNDSQISYNLVRSGTVDRFEDVVKLRGMFWAGEGGAGFAECASGVRFDIEPGGDYQTTFQNYMNTPHDLAEPMLVSILGSVQPGFDPQVDSGSIVIDQFRRFYPNRDCGGNLIRAGLTGTYWQLSEIDSKQVVVDDDTRMVFLSFNPDTSIHGYGGCNRISGTYLVKGDVFLFNRGPMTRLACRDGMDVENRLLNVLDEAETYAIEGDVLMLKDQNEQVRARFVAGP